MALIDVSEALFTRHPLTPSMRARSFKPMLRYAEDRDAMARFGGRRFVERYLESARLTGQHCDAAARMIVAVDPILGR